jgi:hypothetical protein
MSNSSFAMTASMAAMRMRLEETEEYLCLPYAAERRPDGVNHGYFDLKRNPLRIAEVPEIYGWPELESVIKTANHHDSLFRTLGCEIVLMDFDDLRLKKRLVSYVDIAFEILSLNGEKENYHQLFRRLEQFAAPFQLPGNVSIIFEICPTRFDAHQFQGWRVTLWNAGVGRSDSEARAAWHLGVEVFKHFISTESAQWGDLLSRGFKTIS